MSAGATVLEGMTQQQVEETMAAVAQTTIPASEAMPPALAATVAVAHGAGARSTGVATYSRATAI